jgi:hypothetical protein
LSSDLLQPAAMLPALVTDHGTGLAMLRTWSCESGGCWRVCGVL